MLLLNAIAIVESAGKPVAGDHGAAQGMFQMHRAAWQDVYDRFGAPGKKPHLDVGEKFMDIAGTDPLSMTRAQNAATGYVVILTDDLTRANVKLTPANICACWEIGFEGFRRRHFNLKECPVTTRKAAARVSLLAAQP